MTKHRKTTDNGIRDFFASATVFLAYAFLAGVIIWACIPTKVY